MKHWLVCFDAVETLIKTRVPVAETYYQIGKKHHSHLSLEEITTGLKYYYPLYFSSESISKLGSSEKLERDNWKNLVGEIFSDLANIDHLFSELWFYYAQPMNWEVIPETYSCLKNLSESGIEIAIASNFDRRLNLIANQLIPEVKNENIFTSSRLGYAKPDIRFYKQIENMFPSENFNFLMIGDDRKNDHYAALSAGWSTCSLKNLANLKEYLSLE